MWEQRYKMARYFAALIVFLEINVLTTITTTELSAKPVANLTSCPAEITPLPPAPTATVQDMTEQCLAWMLDTNFIEAKKRICNKPTK